MSILPATLGRCSCFTVALKVDLKEAVHPIAPFREVRPRLSRTSCGLSFTSVRPTFSLVLRSIQKSVKFAAHSGQSETKKQSMSSSTRRASDRYEGSSASNSERSWLDKQFEPPHRERSRSRTKQCRRGGRRKPELRSPCRTTGESCVSPVRKGDTDRSARHPQLCEINRSRIAYILILDFQYGP